MCAIRFRVREALYSCQFIFSLIIGSTAFAAEPFLGFEKGLVLDGEGTVLWSSPVVADIDQNLGNGKEIVVVTGSGHVHAISSQGYTLWTAELPNANCTATTSSNKALSSPSVGAIYGDGVPYVVAGYGGVGGKECGGGVAAFHGATGNMKWDFSLQKHNDKEGYWSYLYSVYSTPALFDTNGDGTLEIGFGSFDRRVYLLSHKGKKPLWKSVVADTVWSSASFAYMSDTKNVSMFIGTDISKNNLLSPPTPDGGYLYRYHTTKPLPKRCAKKRNKKKLICKKLGKVSTTSYGFRDPRAFSWYKVYDQVLYAAPVVADLIPERDGLELVIGSGSYFPENSSNKRGKWLSIVDAESGETIRTIKTAGTNESSVAVADVDGDGNLEIISTFNVSTSEGGSGTGQIAAYNPRTGAKIWEVSSNAEGSDPNASRKYSATVGDLNGDGGQEVVVANGGSIRIYDGTSGLHLECMADKCTNGRATLKLRSTTRNTPVIADLDGDGTLDLIAASGDRVYAWKNFAASLAGSTAGANPPYTSDWPMWRGNAARTGSLIKE